MYLLNDILIIFNMKRLFYFILSIIFLSISSIFFILYLNLFNIGYNVFEYLLFCLTKIECLLVIPGIIILIKLHK